MARSFAASALLFLLALNNQVQSRPHAHALEKSLCSLVEVALPQRVDAISAGPAKFAPGYLVGVSGNNSNSQSDRSGVPDGKICTVTGYPVEERDGALGKALLSRCGLSLPGGTIHTAMAEGVCVQDQWGAPLAFLFTEAGVRGLCLSETFVLKVSCPDDDVGGHTCYTLSLQASHRQERRVFRRRALSVQPGGGVSESRDSQVPGSGLPAVMVGVVVGVVGLLVLVLVLAMCGGGEADRYDTVPGKGTSATNRMAAGDVVASPSPPAELPDRAPVVKVLKTNGTPSVPPADRETTPNRQETTPSRQEPVPSREQSAERQSLSTASLKDVSERGRTLSARSFDPLPEVPKLELAERADDEKGEDKDDEDDDDPYAEVPRDDVERMADSESDEEKNGGVVASPVKGSSPFLPYGKVSRHGKPASESKEVDDTDSYAEVRDVIRRVPPSLGQRGRSHTQPPNTGDLASPRDKRSQTESAAHLPLPDIPGAAATVAAHPLHVQETAMYDSIENQVKKPSPSSEPKKKERLYESVEEMEEKDLYESVPDSLSKVDSPTTPNSLTTPTTAYPRMLSDMHPMPPRSPIPSRSEHTKGEQQSKKALEKTLSASHTAEDGKRRFSFFRKKTASVSSTRPKKGEQPESPTALVAVSSSPQHKAHPLPNIPVPARPDDDDDEDTYDRVTPVLDHSGIFQQGIQDDTKAKSMSLPMAFRTGGGRPNLPLPRLPEDSGSGTVQHQRVMEGGPDDYDMVQKGPDRIPDEPNYDTVRLEGPSSQAIDPPYDKIDKKELQEFRERELQSRENLGIVLSGPDDLGKYSTVRGEESVGNDQPGLPPDHDEEGYAVVPEEIRMRKRAMSASQAVKQKQQQRSLSPDSAAAGYRTVRYQDAEKPYDTILETRPHSKTVSSPYKSKESSEDQYATVDMAAKRDKKQQELEEALRVQDELRAYSEEPPRASPIPPPLPPALDPEDMEEEFQQPPIPFQSDGVHELVASGELEVPRPDSGDPPYARVKSKTDNPYAEVNRLCAEVQSDGMHELVASGELEPDSGDPPYARVKSKTDNPYAKVMNRPYAEVDVDWLQSTKRSSGETAEDNAPDEAAAVGVKVKEDKPYDTIKDLMAEMESGGAISCLLEQEMPKLETAEPAIYDSLLPEQDRVSSPDDDTKKDTPRSMV